jgi:hypothetical protein
MTANPQDRLKANKRGYRKMGCGIGISLPHESRSGLFLKCDPHHHCSQGSWQLHGQKVSTDADMERGLVITSNNSFAASIQGTGGLQRDMYDSQGMWTSATAVGRSRKS